MTDNILLALRFVMALIFVVSGFEKAVSPPENFLYLLQAYDFLPGALVRPAALVFPWIELAIGVFLTLGLWTRLALTGLLCMSGSLILVVGQAIMRRLPIESCGCFGDLVHLPLRGVIILDMAVFAGALYCSLNIAAVRRFSLDNLFDRQRP
jgi:uncharacterized membrane protein YphA (DoxX/SURF4 family)